MVFKIALPAVLLAVATRGLPVANLNKDMPTFKHFFLDAEPQPGTHFYPHMVHERNSEEIPEEPLASAESAPAPHYAPAPYAPPPPGAWAYEPMFMPAPPSYGHPAPAPAYGHPAPAPAYGHPEPGPYFVAPAPYHPEPAPYHAPAPLYDPKLEPFHPSKMPEFKTYSYKFVAPAAPAPEEGPSIDLRTAKAIDEESSFENELPKESGVKEGPFDVSSIVEASIEEAPLEEAPEGFFEMCGSFLCPKEKAPLEEAPLEEAPVEEASLEEVSIEEELLEDAAEEDFILEEEIIEEAPLEEAPIEEIVTEEPSDEESVTEAIVFLSEIDQVSAPSRFF